MRHEQTNRGPWECRLCWLDLHADVRTQTSGHLRPQDHYAGRDLRSDCSGLGLTYNARPDYSILMSLRSWAFAVSKDHCGFRVHDGNDPVKVQGVGRHADVGGRSGYRRLGHNLVLLYFQ